jgi:hypothetical protein
MNLMLKEASYIEAPGAHASKAVSAGSTIVNSGTPVDGKPTEFHDDQDDPPPEDSSQRFMEQPENSTGAQDTPSSTKEEVPAPKLVNSPESAPDKEFMQTPWVKPPRREAFNESATRGWRNDYQREYRAEHGNGA